MLYRISERDEKGQFPTIVFFMRRDLKKEEDGGDGGKANEQEDGEGEADPFQGTLRDRKREHSSLVWIPQGFSISIIIL